MTFMRSLLGQRECREHLRLYILDVQKKPAQTGNNNLLFNFLRQGSRESMFMHVVS